MKRLTVIVNEKKKAAYRGNRQREGDFKQTTLAEKTVSGNMKGRLPSFSKFSQARFHSAILSDAVKHNCSKLIPSVTFYPYHSPVQTTYPGA
ncbi:MAG: hypothetical protein ABFS24_00435 [Pseudomonadota bacterium]